MLALAVVAASPAWAQAPTFSITRFEIEGNSLLSAGRLREVVQPFEGQGKSFSDVQLALEALERAYRSLGYSAVAVTLPEQEITAGVIRFVVVEAKLDTITLSGNERFSQDNILRSLPALRSGQMPNAIAMAEDIALANENPAKRTEITLRISDKPGWVNADVKVEEDRPQKFYVSLDNTGQGSTTGDWRLGLAWMHANLFDRDHVLNLQYTTSPTHVSDVTQLNVGYRVPLYGLGDSVDLYAGSSNVDAGTFGAASGIDGFVGKGQIFGLRYNLNLDRSGEYDHSLALGLDWKRFDNNCTGPACGLTGADVEAAPLSISYRGTWTRPSALTSWTVSHIRNTGWGSLNTDANYATATHQPGTVGTSRRFGLWRLNLSHLQGFGQGWQGRLNVAMQMTSDALITGEQLGLAGASAVRGFHEREVARDQGTVLNVELYTPSVAPRLKLKLDELRGLVFLDTASGRFNRNGSETSDLRQSVTSVGFGVRLTHQKRINLRFDVARVIQGTVQRPAGDWSGHFALTAAF